MKELLALTLGMMIASSQPAVASQQPEAPFAFTSDYFVGSWTDTEDCSNAIVLRADWIFLNAAGGGGRWSLNGNQMQMVLPGGSTISFTVLPESRNKVWLFHQDGRVGASTRC